MVNSSNHGKMGKGFSFPASYRMSSAKGSRRKGPGQHLGQMSEGKPQWQLELSHPLRWLPLQINRTCSTYFPNLGTCKASAQWLFWKQDAISGKNVPSKVNKHEMDRMLCSINTNHRLFWLLNFLNTRFLSRLSLLSPSFSFFWLNEIKNLWCLLYISQEEMHFFKTFISPIFWKYFEFARCPVTEALLFCIWVDWLYFNMNTHNWYGAHLLSVTLAWRIFMSRLSRVPPDTKMAGTRKNCPSSKW